MARDPTAFPVQGPDTPGTPVAVSQYIQLGGSGVPANANQSANNAGNASLTVSISSAVGKRSYLTGFGVSCNGATAAGNVDLTITGLLGGTLHRSFQVSAGVGTADTGLDVTFGTPWPASADNTSITLTFPAAGAGNTAMAAYVTGFTA